MGRKPNPLPDDPKQSKRFIEAARELETDNSREQFERVFDKVVSKKPKGRDDRP